MSSGTIIHFGADTSHRIPVLRAAGYDVAFCDTLREFEAIVNTTTPDAVLFTVGDGDARSVVSTIHQWSAAPVIVFDTDDYEQPVDFEIDLIVEPVTHPTIWLESIQQLIENTRQSRAHAAETRQSSQKLRIESAELRQKSAQERKRSSELSK